MAIPREDLTSYIDHSRAVQRSLRWVATIGILLAVILGWAVGAGGFAIAALLTVGITGIGLWITQGHIVDFENQLRATGGSRAGRAARRGASSTR
jgi:hypothetical protein